MKKLTAPSGRNTSACVALVLLLAACGGSDSDGSGSDTIGDRRSAMTDASNADGSSDEASDDDVATEVGTEYQNRFLDVHADAWGGPK